MLNGKPLAPKLVVREGYKLPAKIVSVPMRDEVPRERDLMINPATNLFKSKGLCPPATPL